MESSKTILWAQPVLTDHCLWHEASCSTSYLDQLHPFTSEHSQCWASPLQAAAATPDLCPRNLGWLRIQTPLGSSSEFTSGYRWTTYSLLHMETCAQRRALGLMKSSLSLNIFSIQRTESLHFTFLLPLPMFPSNHPKLYPSRTPAIQHGQLALLNTALVRPLWWGLSNWL